MNEQSEEKMETVHVELSNFVPKGASRKARKQGKWDESNATLSNHRVASIQLTRA